MFFEKLAAERTRSGRRKRTGVRVDADFAVGGWNGFAFDHPGASSGTLWGTFFEKSYAWFRTGVNTYASLATGWMNTVYSDFGIPNTPLTFGSNESSFYNTVANALAANKPVTFGTNTAPPNLVANHAYTLVGVSIDGSGNTLYILRNPWGFGGTAYENAAGYVTLTFAQMKANFTQGVMAL